MAFDFDESGQAMTLRRSSVGFDFDEDGNQVTTVPKSAPEGGFMASAKQAAGAIIKGAGQAAADFIPSVDDDNAVKRYGQNIIDANPTAVHSLGDIADTPGTAVREATGNAAGSMAGIVGARALGQGITALAPFTGPAAPATALLGQAIAWFGPAAIAALPSYGGIREKQILNDPENNASWRAKAIAGLGAATVGAIEVKFGPQEWALAALTKEGRSSLAKKFGETTLAKSIGYGAAKGAAIEGAEELVQNPIEQLASFDNPLTKENLKDTAFSGAMGAMGGGMLGGGTGMMSGRRTVGAHEEPKDDIGTIMQAQTTDEAIAAAAQALDAQPVAEVKQAIGDTDVSTSPAIPPGDTGTAGGGLDIGTASVAVGVGDAGTTGAVEPGGPVAEQPAPDLPQPAAQDLDALRTENAALRNNAVQALQSEQGATPQAEPVSTAGGDVSAETQLPIAGPAALETGRVAPPPVGTAPATPALELPASTTTETPASAPASNARQQAMDAERARIEAGRAKPQEKLQGEQVSVYTGKFKKGMSHEAARIEAARLNRNNADKTITYTAEEHGNAKLDNAWAVVGRRVEKAMGGRKLTAVRNVNGKFQAVDEQGKIIPESPEFATGPEADHWRRMQISKKAPSKVEEYRATAKAAEEAAKSWPRETITPAEDTVLGKNDAGETIYQRKDGSVYRMRMDRRDRPNGYPDFGGDLAPVSEAQKPESKNKDEIAAEIDALGERVRLRMESITGRPEAKIPDINEWTSEQLTELADLKSQLPLYSQEREGAKRRVRERIEQRKAESQSKREEKQPVKKSDEKERLTDAGEELTRNRRNRVTGITWSDVEGMNDTLKIKTVTKPNIWQKPNYEKMVEDGAPRWKAAVLKAIYDRIAAKPDSGRTLTDEQMRRYIETLSEARDAVLAQLDRVENDPRVKAAFESEAVKSFASKGEDYIQAEAVMAMRGSLFNGERIMDALFPMPEGGARLGRFDRTTEQGKTNNTNALLIGGNNALRALQFDYKTFSKARDMLLDGFPAKQEAWEKSYAIKPKDGRFYVSKKGYTFRPADGHPQEGFETEAQAQEFARDVMRKAKDEKPLPPSRGLDLGSVQRTGPDWRNGKDVTAEDVKDAFGFRGVNLGEYVKANQKIAQIHLNHAYDALMDLADLMSVPPKAISLNGTLGLAIGAQGSGRALAHFVPGVNEINITRDSGAGALAHEWGHAMDHYFGVQQGERVAKSSAPFLSEHLTGKPEGVRPEIYDAFKTMVSAMKNRSMTEEEAKKWMDGQKERYADALKYTLRQLKPTDQAAYDDASEKLMAGDIGELDSFDVPANIAKVFDATNGADSVKANVRLSAERLHEMRDEQRFLETHKPQTRTNYDRASGMMDAKKKAPYWSTNLEMFARAFESYVMDALAARQRESLYLSGLSDGPMWKAWEEMSGETSPFPKAEERVAIGQAAQALVDTIKTKETDQGVAMLARGGLPDMLPVDDATEALVQEYGEPVDSILDAERRHSNGERIFAMHEQDDTLSEITSVRQFKGWAPEQLIALHPGVTDDSESLARTAMDPAAFRRAFGAPEPMTVASAREIVDDLTKTWENGPVFKVVATAADLPGNRPADTRGMIQNGTAYIVAANNPTRDQLARTIGHETIGHYGLWKMLGNDGTQRFQKNVQLALKSGNKPLNAIRAKVRRLYVDDKGQFNLTPEQEADEIAAFAVEEAVDPVTGEFKPGMGFFKAVWANVAAFLRKLGLNIGFTNAELQGMLVSAMKGLEAGKKLDGGADVLVAAARQDQPVALPDVIVANSLGTATAHPDYAAAKAGDVRAAVNVAKAMVTDKLVAQVRERIGDTEPLVLPVVAEEAAGRNKIPRAAAEALAKKLGLETAAGITQANRAHRTGMDGLDRLFAVPDFAGPVEAGRDYLLIDDTLTQGATFAALASHIQQGGGRVVGAVALTGKQYSATIKPTAETLNRLREKHGDLEDDFRAATGYGFDALTQSEARYISNFEPAQRLRDRILAEGRRAREERDSQAAGGVDAALASASRGTTEPVATKKDVVGNNQGGRSADDSNTGVSDFQQRVTAAQELADSVRDTGQRLTINSDGTVTLFHSTSTKNAQSIRDAGKFTGNTWFSPSKAATLEHAKPKHGSDTETLSIKVDPRDIEFSTGTGEFYAPNGLERDEHGVWKNPNEPQAPDSGGALARSPNRPQPFEPVRTKNGTAYKSDAVALAAPKLNRRQPDNGLQRIDYLIRDRAAFAQAKADGKTDSEALEASHAGYVTMDVDSNGDFKELRYIMVFESKRGSGIAGKVVGAIMGTVPEGQSLRINDILQPAVDFWAKMGAKFPRSSEFMAADLTPEQYRRAYETQGPTGRARDQREDSGPQADARGTGRGPGAYEALARGGPEPGDDGKAGGKIVGKTRRQHTSAQLRAMRNVGFDVDQPSLKDRAKALWQGAGNKMAQGIFDQFEPVSRLDNDAYTLLRLSKGASGAVEAFLHGGRLKLTDGVYDFDDQNKGGVIDRLLIPLQGEHHDFLRWVAANRAEKLKAEGRENLFTEQDIADLKTLADGTTEFDYTVKTGPNAGKVTRDRTLIYADSQRVFNEFNRNVLDMAEQSGLIDGESRHLWESEFYVPFYRVAEEDGGVRGANIKSGVVRQEAFKKLKGGTQELNADLLDNTLMNWAHLLDAAAKNRAAKATIEAAANVGAATPVPAATKKSVWYMDGGQKVHAVVHDPHLLTAISALEYAGMRNPVMNAMGFAKHVLTIGVTASPYFKIRNLIRDSVQAIGTGNLSYNLPGNVTKGWALTNPKADAYFRLLAGGGTIHFGTMLEGNEAKRVQALVESGIDQVSILDSDKKVKAFYRKFVEPGITAYNELGNRGEAINRASLYDQLVKQGVSHADASLQARDLMDFSMQGSWTTIRFLTQVVPFFNARLQGMYKLGRAAKSDPARFSIVIGAAALMSIALLAAYHDDDDWKKREDWDRNNYWWFKFGGIAFRIPKPFEIGAIATLAERGLELAIDDEMTGKRFREQVLTLLSDNLSMNPVPQLVKPIVDVYANKDSFTGRPIESMSMERLKPEYRFNDRTSMTARGASTAINAATGVVGVDGPSPVQIDHMLRGYFGWLGSFVVGAGDIVARPATGQPGHPAADRWKVATGGLVSDLRDAPSRYVTQMYTQAKEIDQAYGTWRELMKQGKKGDAKEFMTENLDKLKKHDLLQTGKREMSQINERIRHIERSAMSPDDKREKIRRLQERKDYIARKVTQ